MEWIKNELHELVLKNGYDRCVLFYVPPLIQFAHRLSSDLNHPLLNELEDGEEIKCREVKEKVEDFLLEQGCGKKTLLIAIGGGTVLDLIGFVAATYMRGIDYVTFPSTLLALCDASIGGKVGINVKGAKNVLGAFYPPIKIFRYFPFLETLSEKEITHGLAEVIKHGLIASKPLFEKINLNNYRLEELIEESISIKVAIVDRDPFEKLEYRYVLNFGHTIGHALEKCSEYKLSHGSAVALGMAFESYLSWQKGLLDRDSFHKIMELLLRLNYPFSFFSKITFQELIEALAFDKKKVRGNVRFVLLASIGRADDSPHIIQEKFLEEAYAYFRHLAIESKGKILALSSL